MIVLKKTIICILSQVSCSLYGMSEWIEISKQVEKKIDTSNGVRVDVLIKETVDGSMISDASLKILIGLSRAMLQIKSNGVQCHEDLLYEDPLHFDYKNIINEQKIKYESMTLKEYVPLCKHQKCVHFIAEYPLNSWCSASMFEYNGIRKGIVEGTYSLEEDRLLSAHTYLKVVQP